MIAVRFFRNRFRNLRGFAVYGHADAAPHGKDIVCAAVSALTQTAVNALETVAGIKPGIRMEEGFLYVRLPKGLSRRQRRTVDTILRTTALGLADIAAVYTQHIHFHQHDKRR